MSSRNKYRVFTYSDPDSDSDIESESESHYDSNLQLKSGMSSPRIQRNCLISSSTRLSSTSGFNVPEPTSKPANIEDSDWRLLVSQSIDTDISIFTPPLKQARTVDDALEIHKPEEEEDAPAWRATTTYDSEMNSHRQLSSVSDARISKHLHSFKSKGNETVLGAKSLEHKEEVSNMLSPLGRSAKVETSYKQQQPFLNSASKISKMISETTDTANEYSTEFFDLADYELDRDDDWLDRTLHDIERATTDDEPGWTSDGNDDQSEEEDDASSWGYSFVFHDDDESINIGTHPSTGLYSAKDQSTLNILDDFSTDALRNSNNKSNNKSDVSGDFNDFPDQNERVSSIFVVPEPKARNGSESAKSTRLINFKLGYANLPVFNAYEIMALPSSNERIQKLRSAREELLHYDTNLASFLKYKMIHLKNDTQTKDFNLAISSTLNERPRAVEKISTRLETALKTMF